MPKGINNASYERLAKVAQTLIPENNAYLYTDDPFIVYLYDRKETTDTFGEDHLQEFGTYVPEELIERYKNAKKEFFEVQKELGKYTESFV